MQRTCKAGQEQEQLRANIRDPISGWKPYASPSTPYASNGDPGGLPEEDDGRRSTAIYAATKGNSASDQARFETYEILQQQKEGASAVLAWQERRKRL